MNYNIREHISLLVKIFFAYFVFMQCAISEEKLSKQELDKIMYEYIMENPQVILDSVDRLRKKMEEDSKLDEDYLKENFMQFANNPNIPYMGSDTPKVIIIEFFDYNCSYCKKSLDAVAELLRTEYDLKISFRDYPILSPSSRIAAKAALAAKKQGKYFSFHSALMSMQGNLNEDKIFTIANNLEMDIEKLKIDMQKDEIEEIIEDNESLARKLNIRGTPTFIINGKLYAGALDLKKLRQIINNSLQDS
ncbi:MAG: thioredoxin domain-containing protein [Pelagibacterales bacterium]|nr:thioredoxin domain-containing protein [Pelagibacterales bacterium]